MNSSKLSAKFLTPHETGFTLIEVLMTIALIGILAAVAIPQVGDVLDQERWDVTYQRMKDIRNAYVGDPNQVGPDGHRTSFGYLGDIGNLPNSADYADTLTLFNHTLFANVGWGAWTVNAASRIGYGWNGPYISTDVAAANYQKDAWGNSFVYDSTGATVTLTSYGKNGVAGGTGFDQDLVVQFPPYMKTGATLAGRICTVGTTTALDITAEIVLTVPHDGNSTTLAPVSITQGVDNGAFTINNVPMGVRSITVYSPTQAAPTNGTISAAIVVVDRPYTLAIINAPLL